MTSDTSFMSVSDKVYASLSAILALVITFLSLLLVVAILTSRKWRQSLHHVTIASLTVGDLIVGLIVCPIAFFGNLFIYHPCSDTVAAFAGAIAILVSCWGLVFLHVYYLLSVLGVRPRGLSDRSSTALRVLGSLMPWILALIVVLSFAEPGGWSEPCRMSVGRYDWVYFVIFTWLPLSIVLVLSVANIICHRFCRPTGADAATAQLIRTAKSGVGSPYAMVAVSLFTAAMLLPLDIFAASNNNRLFHASSNFFIKLMSLMLLRNAKSAVVPLLWMADADIRARMANAICCRCHQDDEDAIESEVTYKSLEQKHDVSMDEKVRP